MAKAMKYFTGLALALAIVVGATATLGAETELGQICFRGTSFADTLRLTLVRSTTATGTVLINVYGRWRGSTAYQVLGSGTLTSRDAITGTGTYQIGFTAAHGTAFFGGNHTCSFFSPWGGVAPNFSVQCSGSAGAAFQVNVAMAQVACTAAMEEEQIGLPLAGDSN
jgi:hypothetical protein